MWKTFFIRLHHSMKIFSHFNRKSMNFLSFLCFPLLIARQRNRNWWQRLKWNWFSIEIRWMFETTLIAWSKNAFEFATFSYQPVQSQSPLVFQRFSTHDRKIRAFPTRLEQNRLLPMNEVAILRAIVAAGRQSNCLPRLYTKHFLVSGVKEGIRSVWLADAEENIFFRQLLMKIYGKVRGNCFQRISRFRTYRREAPQSNRHFLCFPLSDSWNIFSNFSLLNSRYCVFLWRPNRSSIYSFIQVIRLLKYFLMPSDDRQSKFSQLHLIRHKNRKSSFDHELRWFHSCLNKSETAFNR